MRRYDFWTSIFWFTISILIIYYSRKLGLGSFSNFGPGFVFYWTGIILGILAIILFIQTMKQKGGERSEKHDGAFKKVNWLKIIGVVFSLTLYGVIYERLGFLVSTFLFIGFLLYSIGAKKWYVVVGVAFATSVLAYAFFELLLKTNLPKGILRI